MQISDDSYKRKAFFHPKSVSVSFRQNPFLFPFLSVRTKVPEETITAEEPKAAEEPMDAEEVQHDNELAQPVATEEAKAIEERMIEKPKPVENYKNAVSFIAYPN